MQRCMPCAFAVFAAIALLGSDTASLAQERIDSLGQARIDPFVRPASPEASPTLPSPLKDLFKSLPGSGKAGDTTMIRNGEVIEELERQRDFLGTRYAENAETAERCTATLIGPNTVLTGAHCVATSNKLKLYDASTVVTATCSHPADYKTTRQDYALCLLDEAITNVPYEHVGLDPALLEGDPVLILAGFGCAEFGGSGKLRKGTARIEKHDDINPNLFIAKGGASVCYGDSGGAVFVEKDGKKIIVGVNSEQQRPPLSIIAKISAQPAQAFFKKWDKDYPICGISQQIGCR